MTDTTDARDAAPTWQPSAIELERRAFRKRQTGRSVLVSALSTIVLAGLLAWAFIGSPGWAEVQQTFFDPTVAIASLPRILEGLWLNIQVLVAASIGVVIVALLLASMRTLRGPVFFPLRALAAGYTDLFRGMPLIIVLYLIGYGVPGLEFFPRMPVAVLGTIALILTYSAYVSEVFRSGIEAVHPSQRLAARSLGLSHAQTMRRIVLPQAFRKVTPALMNDFVAMQKDVGLISVLGAVDAVRAAQIETAHYFNFTPYVVAGLLFVLLAWPMIRLTDWLSARMRAREQVGSIV
ncbi:polar amino acid transport system permease protein [Agromyces hippuratus]|uniref:Polar amino acid transport system permease protein n=1 Tax=Agromyces hippuratus TaxID=286438 RepID=A0A852WMG1_9MICO|nr:amino acid ABC transporter permease [Agromyces hippuratus]NYG19322.1 polar amino acid transport system permease protein [Agromyces hippuratus]